MIPKKIHYCWFGNNRMPRLAKKCIKSWKKYCPDYQIICWNEESFDLNSNEYVREAYDSKKYAFVTDYVRLLALYTQGGVYMDTDVEIINNIDSFLQEKAFSGFESDTMVPTGIMASESKLKIFEKLLSYYDDRHFIKEDGTFDLVSNVTTITNIMIDNGLNPNNKLQKVCEMSFYPKEYFCPIEFDKKIKNITQNTYAIHWFSGSWVPKKDRIKMRLYNVMEKLFGNKTTTNILKHVRKK